MSEPMQAFPRGPDYPGMTLRDYFAAQALPQVTGMAPLDTVGIAMFAYRLADAMIRAREGSL